MLRSLGLWLERLRPLWVGAALLTLVAAEARYAPVGMAALAVLWAWSGVSTGRWLGLSPLALPWLIWLAMVPVTLWATAAPELTREALAALAAQGIAFWAMSTWTRNDQRMQWAWGGLMLAALALSGLSLFWLEWSGRLFAVPAAIRSLAGGPGPLQGEVVNKNVMAGVLVGLWPLALAWAATPWERGRLGRQAAGAAVAAAVLAVLVLSQSRGAWLAAAGSLFLLAAMRWPRLWWAAPIALAAGLALLVRGGVAAVMQSDALGGLDGRLELWSRALYALQDFAFTGIGMGAFRRVIPLLYPYFVFEPTADINHAHNLWLQVGVDLGMPGLVAFLSMGLATAALLWHALARGPAGVQPRRWFLRGAVAGLTAALIHGILDVVTWNTRPAFLVWAVWGAAVGMAAWTVEQQAVAGLSDRSASAAQEA
ncbi:MAG: O-antigen ligase family protein [Caldilineales bacterium]|nr:O-antigen ligase family protein [Caldilineales bacterium]